MLVFGLGFVWGKFQILGMFKGLLRVALVFSGLVWGLFRVGLGCIFVVHLKLEKQNKQKTAEKQNSEEAEKQRSRETRKGRKAEKQRNRETHITYKKNKTEKISHPKNRPPLHIPLLVYYIPYHYTSWLIGFRNMGYQS